MNREAFEAWYKNNFGEPDFLRGACGTYYMSSSVDFAWQTWQAALASQAQQPAKPFIYISEDEFAWRSKSGDLNGTRSLTCITPQHFGEKHYGNFTVPLYLQPQAQQPTEVKPYGYAVEEADGEVKFFSTFDRPAESYAFKVKTRKVVPLYSLPPAPEGGE